MSIYNPNGKKLNHIVIIKKLLGIRIQNTDCIFFMITIIKLYMPERLLKKNLKIDRLNILMSMMGV